MDATTLHVLLVVFFATLIRSAFGFGEALFAVPLLALRLPLGIAAPLAVLISITIAGVVVAQDWEKIHWRSTGWLVVATVVGIPPGLLLLTSSHQRAAKVALAVFLIAFCLYSLRSAQAAGTGAKQKRNSADLAASGESAVRVFLKSSKLPELKTDRLSWLLCCGFFAGVLGGAYGMNGPPLVIYGAMRRWSAQRFRANLQGYFLPASILGMAGYWWRGLWVPAVTHYYLISLPATLPAIFLGRVVNHKLGGESFLKYIYLLLAGIGSVLLIQAVTR